MTEAFDRYSLALGVLHGEPDTHKILADVLEDQGDRGLAAWARARKSRRTKRLDFVLAVLPYRTTLRLGCEFLRHAVADPKANRLNRGIELIHDWTKGESTAAELDQGCTVLSQVLPTRWEFDVRSLDSSLQALHRAARLAHVAAEYETAANARKCREHASLTSDAVRRVAKSSRVVAQEITIRNRYSRPPSPGVFANLFRRDRREPQVAVTTGDELSWQCDRVEQVIVDILEQS